MQKDTTGYPKLASSFELLNMSSISNQPRQPADAPQRMDGLFSTNITDQTDPVQGWLGARQAEARENLAGNALLPASRKVATWFGHSLRLTACTSQPIPRHAPVLPGLAPLRVPLSNFPSLLLEGWGRIDGGVNGMPGGAECGDSWQVGNDRVIALPEVPASHCGGRRGRIRGQSASSSRVTA